MQSEFLGKTFIDLMTTYTIMDNISSQNRNSLAYSNLLHPFLSVSTPLQRMPSLLHMDLHN
jgi:hypothetical protein